MQREIRRSHLLTCAKEVFSRKGYHDTSVSDIIGRAGIARGTFYLYFESKRNAFDCLLDDLLEELDCRIQRVRLGPGEPTPMDQLRANLERVFSLLLEDRDLTRILLDHAVGLDQESRGKLGEFYDRVLGMIEHSLVLGTSLGLVRPCEPGIVARFILGGVKETVRHLALTQDPSLELPDVAEEILTLGLHGVLFPSTTITAAGTTYYPSTN